jgi:hypothetical protein
MPAAPRGPIPKRPMKKLNWSKIQDRDLSKNPTAFWVKARGVQSPLAINYSELEEKFSQRAAEIKGDVGKATAKV